MRRVVLLGGTKGMGRALARRMSQRGDRLVLLGRNLDDLDRSARDLEARGTAVTSVGRALCDLERPETFIPALEQASAHLGGFDTVVVTAGLYETQERLESDPELARRVLTADFTNTILFCEYARSRILAQGGGGTLCVFSSVAGDRSRKPVVLYGAAKAGLSYYLEGLDYRFHGQGLRTICVKPGFVNTSMTQGLRKPPFAAEADDVAREVLEAIDRGTPTVYGPPLWALIMFVVRRLPRWVMRRTEF